MGSQSSFIYEGNTGERYPLTDDNWKKMFLADPVPLFQSAESYASLPPQETTHSDLQVRPLWRRGSL